MSPTQIVLVWLVLGILFALGVMSLLMFFGEELLRFASWLRSFVDRLRKILS